MKRDGQMFSDNTVKCPFCGFVTDIGSSNQACGGCYVEFYQSRGRLRIIFDTSRKTKNSLGYAYARCFSGVSLGRIQDDD